MAVVNALNTTPHSSKEIAEFSFEMQMLEAFVIANRERVKSKLSLSSECVETKLCKLCTSFTLHLHSSCEIVWYSTLRSS